MKPLIILFLIALPFGKKQYQKRYHDNGKLKSEGWVINEKKSGYWYFYNKSEQKIAEGHFKNGMKTKWWIFYNDKNEITHKCQLKNNRKNGYCLKYKSEELVSAEKFENGKKINEWFSFSSFKKHNNLSDLK